MRQLDMTFRLACMESVLLWPFPGLPGTESAPARAMRNSAQRFKARTSCSVVVIVLASLVLARLQSNRLRSSRSKSKARPRLSDLDANYLAIRLRIYGIRIVTTKVPGRSPYSPTPRRSGCCRCQHCRNRSSKTRFWSMAAGIPGSAIALDSDNPCRSGHQSEERSRPASHFGFFGSM